MRGTRKGRAHLERLLNKAEKVVRVSPADILVLTGVNDFDSWDPAGTLEEFERLGVQARGLVGLESGMDIDSIDMEELARMDALADEVDEGTLLVNSVTEDGLTVSTQCPRCPEMLQMTISASIHDTGDRLIGSTTVDSRDMELHAILCKGTKPTSQ